MEGRPLTAENVDLFTLDWMTEQDEPSTEIDEAALQALWRTGKVAWAGVPNASEWVEEQRR